MKSQTQSRQERNVSHGSLCARSHIRPWGRGQGGRQANDRHSDRLPGSWRRNSTMPAGVSRGHHGYVSAWGLCFYHKGPVGTCSGAPGLPRTDPNRPRDPSLSADPLASTSEVLPKQPCYFPSFPLTMRETAATAPWAVRGYISLTLRHSDSKAT